MRTLFTFLVFALVSVLAGCSSIEKTSDIGKSLVVSAFWAKSTLATNRNDFRKINRMTPVIFKDQIIAGNAHDGLVSYDLESKNEKWRLKIPLGVESSAAAINYLLFVGSNNGKLYSIDMRSGEIVWTFDTKSELVAEPLLEDGTLYIISGNQTLYALDASSGKQLWLQNRQDTSNNMTVRGGSKPSLSQGVLFAGFSDGSLLALNAKTGSPVWEVTLNRNSRFKDIDSSPVVDGDYIYVNSYDDKVYCLTRDKGQIIWSAKIGGSASPRIVRDQVIVSSSNGDLESLDKKTGKMVWKRSFANGVLTDVEIYKDFIVTGESQGKLLFLDLRTGKDAGSFEPGRGVFSKPAIKENMLFFVSGEGNLFGVTADFPRKSNIHYLK